MKMSLEKVKIIFGKGLKKRICEGMMKTNMIMEDTDNADK